MNSGIFKYLFFITILFAACKSKQKTQAKSEAPKQYISQKDLSEKQRLDFTYLYINASKEKVLGNYDLAESLYSQCIRIDPANSSPYYEIANINNFQGNTKVALENIKKAVHIEPSNVWYNMLFAEILLKEKKYGDAAAVYQKMTKLNPDRPDLYFALAAAQTYAGKKDDAIKTYEKLESLIGVSEEISMEKLRIYKGVENFDNSLKELKKLILAFPKEGKYYGMLGELYQQKGMKEKALETYNELLRVDPDNPFVHLSLADYYRSLNQNEKSFAELKLAFKNSGLDIDAKISILLSYYTVTETYPELKDEAFDLCKILVEVHPIEAKAHSIYGDFLYRDKKIEQARDAYRKSISLDKERFALWQQLLIIESEMEDFEAMEKESKEAIELFPNQPLPYFMNGFAKLQKKNYNEAIEILNEGKNFVFDNKILLGQFYSNLGDAYYRLNKYPESDEAYEKALELEPDNVYVLNNYAYYLSLRNEKLQQAEEMSKRSNEIQPNNNSYQDTYGWILYKMGRYNEAKNWIEKAVENGGQGNSVILEHLGDVYFKLGNTSKAAEYWELARQKGKGSESLDRKIAEKKLSD